MKIKFCSIFAFVTSAVLLLSSCSMFRTATSPEESSVLTSAPDSTDTEAVTELRPVIPAKDPDDPLTVCIDAGHGYTDPGCTTKYLDGRYEREIVAEYADILKEKLEGEGYRVILLRDDENYVDAAEIADTARKLGMTFLEDKLVDDGRFAPYNRAVWTNVLHRETYIDLFVSLHIDSFDSMESVRGTRIYYCTDTAYSVSSKRLCDTLSETVKEALPDTNARSFPKNTADAYVVTKHTEMPSVLIEMGFATNPDDAANILNEDWRDSFCAAVAAGIKNYAG